MSAETQSALRSPRGQFPSESGQTIATSIALVDLKRQYEEIKNEVDQAMARVLAETSFVLGEEVSLFESEFAAYCEAECAVGVDSGLSALELGMLALGIGPGDEVVTPANSFIASSAAVSAVGATPVLVDMDPRTYTIDPDEVTRKITPRTKAVMPVHLYGQPADMDAIMHVAAAYGLLVIEDACQAHGARYRGHRVGSFGHVAAFSFYPGKNLGAYGDGGMVVTRDPDVAERVRVMRNYGQQEKYKHVALPRNRRLDTLQAAVLRVKLRHLEVWNQRRRELAGRYDAELAETRLRRPTVGDGHTHVYHLYVVQAEMRDQLQMYLRARGIATGIHYPVPVHLQPVYAELGHRHGDFPVTERCAQRLLSLPMFPELTEAEVKHVVNTIKEFFPTGVVREADVPRPAGAERATV